MGATKLQFVPYAAHAFTASIAENGTQWTNGASSSIEYSAGSVNIGTAAGTGALNVEKSTSTSHVLTATQTSNGGGYQVVVYGKNNSTTGNGIGVYGSQDGNGWGVFGKAAGTSGIGVFAERDLLALWRILQ